MEKMMDPNIIDYYIIDCAIPSIIKIKYCYRIDVRNPGSVLGNSYFHIFKLDIS